jgi:hypothetical protein
MGEGGFQIVPLVCLFGLSGLFRSTNQMNETNYINQRNEMNLSPSPRRQMGSGVASLLEIQND